MPPFAVCVPYTSKAEKPVRIAKLKLLSLEYVFQLDTVHLGNEDRVPVKDSPQYLVSGDGKVTREEHWKTKTEENVEWRGIEVPRNYYWSLFLLSK